MKEEDGLVPKIVRAVFIRNQNKGNLAVIVRGEDTGCESREMLGCLLVECRRESLPLFIP